MTKNEYVGAIKRLLGWMAEVHDAYAQGLAEDESGRKPLLSVAVFPEDEDLKARASATMILADGEFMRVHVGYEEDEKTETEQTV